MEDHNPFVYPAYVELHAVDSPGRPNYTPVPGDEMYRLTIALWDGSIMDVCFGIRGLENLHVTIRMMMQKLAIEKLTVNEGWTPTPVKRPDDDK